MFVAKVIRFNPAVIERWPTNSDANNLKKVTKGKINDDKFWPAGKK